MAVLHCECPQLWLRHDLMALYRDFVTFGLVYPAKQHDSSIEDQLRPEHFCISQSKAKAICTAGFHLGIILPMSLSLQDTAGLINDGSLSCGLRAFLLK
jgi:hypothetical protein